MGIDLNCVGTMILVDNREKDGKDFIRCCGNIMLTTYGVWVDKYTLIRRNPILVHGLSKGV